MQSALDINMLSCSEVLGQGRQLSPSISRSHLTERPSPLPRQAMKCPRYEPRPLFSCHFTNTTFSLRVNAFVARHCRVSLLRCDVIACAFDVRQCCVGAFNLIVALCVSRCPGCNYFDAMLTTSLNPSRSLPPSILFPVFLLLGNVLVLL